jgi:hypothetical protein
MSAASYDAPPEWRVFPKPDSPERYVYAGLKTPSHHSRDIMSSKPLICLGALTLDRIHLERLEPS